ncbi:MAG TPA: site-specific DNA-methyltransferase [Solirubrobacteraceae bacterium]|jgi:site-specific DNA-methyltransferase (adenine-specific)
MSARTKLALYEDDTRAWGLIEGDALLTLAKLPDASVDAIVTDPPYGIEITGEAWDGLAIRQAVRREGEALSTGAALERWTQVWAAQALRVLKPGGHLLAFGAPRTFHRLVTGVENAGLEVRDQLLWLFGQGLPKSHRLAGGLGTTLKPAYEPILLARAPFAGSTTGNLAEWGTGALNIDATRVVSARVPEGAWPTNVTLSHAPDCPIRMLDQGDTGRSRLFYCAKAPRKEREAGCEQLPARLSALYTGRSRSPRVVRNIHPTVKPLELMRWLVRLITPPGGLVLDPFTGSGSTGAAAVLEGRPFLGIEREGRYVDVACARLTHWAHEAKREAT